MVSCNTEECEKIWLKRIRNLAGFMGMILPWVSLLGAILVARTDGVPEDFWETLSISATYYITPPLVGILTTTAVVLICYKGYEKRDDLGTTISGVFGLMYVPVHAWRKRHQAKTDQEHHLQGLRHRDVMRNGADASPYSFLRQDIHCRSNCAHVLRRKLARER